MKTKIIFFLSIFILFLSSCTTNTNVTVLDRSPSWVPEDLNDENLSYYTSDGFGHSKSIAITNSYEDIYNQLSQNLLIDEKDSFINNLIDNYSYNPIDLKLVNQYLELDNDLYHVISLFSADTALVESQSLENVDRVTNINNQLENYESTSNQAFRDNRDLGSIKTLIAAYIYASDNNVMDKADSYLNTIISRIADIDITVFSTRDLYNIGIRLNRNQGFINPIVINGSLSVSYNTKDINYDNYLVKRELSPNVNNTFSLNLDNININLDGLIIIKLNLDEEIKLLRSKNYIEAAQRIENALKEKVFSYSKISNLDNKSVILTTIENDINQNPLDNISSDFLSQRLQLQNANVIIDNTININNLEAYRNSADYLFLFRAEVVDEGEGLKDYVISHGSLEVYDLNSLELIFDSTLIDSMALGDSIEEGQRASIIQVAKKTLYNFL